MDFVYSLIKPSLKIAALGACAAMTMSVGAYAQSSDVADYKILLQQIDDAKLRVARQEMLVAGQKDKMSFLRSEIAAVKETKSVAPPMIDKMVAALSEQIEMDYPFEEGARNDRLERLKTLVAKPDSNFADKYRRALDILKIEVNYGQSMQYYQGDHPLTPTIREGDDRYQKDENGEIEIDKKTGKKIEIFDGNFLRYGRLAYIYLNNDGSSPLQYDRASRNWVELPNNRADELRRAIRIARGEVAPGVVYAPVMATDAPENG